MSDDIDAIKRDIAATRARLHSSVDELAYRANVPARAKEAVDEKIGAIKDSLLGAVGIARHATAKTAASATSTIERVQLMGESAARSVAAIRETLGEPLERVTEVLPHPTLPKGSSQIMQAFLARNPLGFALAAVAVGLLIGFALPISDIERDTVGPIGQHLIDDAAAAAGDAIEHGKAVIADMAGAA